MQNKIRTMLTKFAKDQRGLSTVEYVILLVLLVAMCVGIWNTFGRNVAVKLQQAGTEFNTRTVTGAAAATNVAAGNSTYNARQ